MIPIRDDQPCFTTPLVTYFLIAVNLLIFLFQSAMTPRGQEALIAQFALIPTHVELSLSRGAGGPARRCPASVYVHVPARRMDARLRQCVGAVDLLFCMWL